MNTPPPFSVPHTPVFASLCLLCCSVYMLQTSWHPCLCWENVSSPPPSAFPLSLYFCSMPLCVCSPHVTLMPKLEKVRSAYSVMNISGNILQQQRLLPCLMLSPESIFISAEKVCIVHQQPDSEKVVWWKYSHIVQNMFFFVCFFKVSWLEVSLPHLKSPTLFRTTTSCCAHEQQRWLFTESPAPTLKNRYILHLHL